MIMPSWQEIIDDILEVLTLRHPALKDGSTIDLVTIGRTSANGANIQANLRDEHIDDFLDALIIHKFSCGHSVKVPKHLYESVKDEFSLSCSRCSV